MGRSPGAAPPQPGVDCHNTTAHFGSNTLTCTSCHGVVQSGTNPGTSAHHGQTAYSAPATCTDCHTPAKGLHTDFVTGLSCTTCHGGYDTAHPDPAAVTPPTVVLSAKPLIVKFGLTTILSGSVKTGTTGAVGKTVTLQAKPAGSTDFATVIDTTTTTGGVYTFVAQSPTMLTTYRVVTQGGLVNTTVVKPALKTLDVKVRPDLTIALSKTRFLLGGSLVIKGKLNPARTGGIVKLTIQKKVGTSWKTKLTKSVALTAGSGYTAYSFTYKPPKLASSRGQLACQGEHRRDDRTCHLHDRVQDLDREVGADEEDKAPRGLSGRCGRAARERGPSASRDAAGARTGARRVSPRRRRPPGRAHRAGRAALALNRQGGRSVAPFAAGGLFDHRRKPCPEESRGRTKATTSRFV